MDAAVVEQYRYLVAVIAAGLLFGLIVTTLADRAATGLFSADAAAPPPSGAPPTIPHAMLALVALAIGAGSLLLLPVLLVVRFYGTWQVLVAVLTGLALLAAPLLYAWRTRPF
jgi:hypothetical protein